MKRISAALTAALLVTAVVVPTAMAASGDSQSSAYSGSHVAFDVENDAIVEYRVDDETMLQSVAVQSESDVESESTVSVGAELGALTDFAGASLAVDASTETSATVNAESGATLDAHDNGHGTLVVASGDSGQYVTASLGADAEASAPSDSRVVVSADGGDGAFVVVGNGTVTVNDEGNVTARLGSDSRLVFRGYPDGRSEGAATTERMIANETVTASAHVMQRGDAVVTDAVQYGNDTTVNVTQSTEGTVEMSVERSAEEGKVVLTTVSEAVLDANENLTVTVDGEAAARASSSAELRQAARSGDQARYLVRGSGSAEAQVFVALTHFSERQVTMEEAETGDPSETSTSKGENSGEQTTSGQSGDGQTTDAQSENEQNPNTETASETSESGGAPGFGVTVAFVALGVAGLLARRAP